MRLAHTSVYNTTETLWNEEFNENASPHSVCSLFSAVLHQTFRTFNIIFVHTIHKDTLYYISCWHLLRVSFPCLYHVHMNIFFSSFFFATLLMCLRSFLMYTVYCCLLSRIFIDSPLFNRRNKLLEIFNS